MRCRRTAQHFGNVLILRARSLQIISDEYDHEYELEHVHEMASLTRLVFRFVSFRFRRTPLTLRSGRGISVGSVRVWISEEDRKRRYLLGPCMH